MNLKLQLYFNTGLCVALSFSIISLMTNNQTQGGVQY